MVACCLERSVDPAEDAFAAMRDIRQFTMHRLRRADHVSAERLAECLMAETDAEHRDAGRRLVDQVEADSGLVRGARPWRQYDGIGVGYEDVIRGHTVVAVDDRLHAQFTE